MSSHRFPITVLLDSLRARFVRRRCAAFFLLAVGLAVLTLNSPLIAAPRYNIVVLDPLPVPPGEDTFGYQSYAYAINEQGVVVGESTLNTSDSIGQTRPVIWNGSSQAVELWDDQNFGGKGLSINSAGFVVGRYGSGSGTPLPGPGIPDGGGFIWNPTTREFKDLGDLGGARVEATGINDARQVSGSSESPEIVIIDGQPAIVPVPRAFIWDEVNGMRDLGTLGGPGSRGTDINEAGKVVGWSIEEGPDQAFIWDPINGMQALGTEGSSRAFAINDHDQVVGSVHGVGGVIWDPTSGLTVLDRMSPRDINNAGQIVGYRENIQGEVGAVIWDYGAGVVFLRELVLNNEGWELWIASSINDSGQIVGYGRFNGDVRAFLATPVPEPSSLMLVICIVLFAGTWRWRVVA